MIDVTQSVDDFDTFDADFISLAIDGNNINLTIAKLGLNASILYPNRTDFIFIEKCLLIFVDCAKSKRTFRLYIDNQGKEEFGPLQEIEDSLPPIDDDGLVDFHLEGIQKNPNAYIGDWLIRCRRVMLSIISE
ncbi:MAG TPA: hypothetical protein VKU00_03560 [Chthonomonadaceae bacterium]|nr:hypothetical protein [Chthonomonadaceae bacterium]